MRINRSVATLLILILNILSGYSIYSQTSDTSSKTKRSTVVGDMRFHKFTSKIFGNIRMIRVLLPPTYDKDPAEKFPVLYLNDGQNLFDIATSQFNSMEWKVDETVKRLIEKGEIESLIVVGIDNAGKRERPNEYLPFPDKYLSPPLPKPQGSKYPDFLIKEIMPFIENRYRVKKGTKNTGLGGSSYGALITLYTVIKKPNVFGVVLLESPSFYVSEAQILKDVVGMRKVPGKIYLGVGTNEEARKDCKPGDLSHEAVQDVLKLEKILRKKIKKRNIKVYIENCAIHNEDAYGRRFPEALKFLYGKN